MPRVICRSVVSTIMSLAWELMCIRNLPLAHCSSSRWWRRFHMSSALVCHGSFLSLATCCLSQTSRRSVSPSSRHGRQVWKVKSSMSSWRRPSRPSSWFLVLAMLSSRNLASTPVLPALGLLATTQSSAHSACGGSTRSAVASLKQATGGHFKPCLPQVLGWGSAYQWQNCGCQWHHAWCGSHFLLPMWYPVPWCHCCQMLCGLGKVQETLVCSNRQVPLT